MIKFRSITTALLLLVLVAFSLGLTTTVSFAGFADVPPSENYVESINRLTKFGVINGDENGMFRPNHNVTREQFIKMLLVSIGKEEAAQKYFGKRFLKDIDEERWSNGYINYAFEKSIISGFGDNTFRPLEEVTFEQATTILVKAIGFQSLEGNWPENYIQKSNDLRISEGLSLKQSDKMSRWMTAVMLDNFIRFALKDEINDESEFQNSYSDFIILENSMTNDSLSKNQIITEKGLLNLKPYIKPLEVGYKYKLLVYGDIVLRVNQKLNSVERATVKYAFENNITYSEYASKQVKTIILPQGIEYYYQGTKVSLETVLPYIKGNTSLVLGKYDENTKYEYVVVTDPIYSNPFIITEPSSRLIKFGKNRITKQSKILRNNQDINLADINANEIVYKVSDMWGKNSYFEIVSDKTIGTLQSYEPNALAVKFLNIDGQKYELGRYFDLEKWNNDTRPKVNDVVVALLGTDGKVVGVFKYDYTSGIEMDVIVLGNSITTDTLNENQILTNKGIFTVSDTSMNLEIGAKYKVSAFKTDIFEIREKMNESKLVTVKSSIGNDITVTDTIETLTMKIPQNILYYYQGSTINVLEAAEVLKTNVTIAFGYKGKSKTQEYAVIVEPIYSKPQIVSSLLPNDIIASLNLQENTLMIRDGKAIGFEELEMYDVIYEVKDMLNTEMYYEVFHAKSEGKITNILPNKVSPNKIEIEGMIYELSRYFPINKLNTSSGSFQQESEVSALLGYDNKVVDLISLTFKDGPEEERIVLSTYESYENLIRGQVLTEQGLYYLRDTNIKLQIGEKYKFVLDGNSIAKVGESVRKTTSIIVDSAVENKVYYTLPTKQTTFMMLPAGITYYYQGNTVTYPNVPDVLTAYSTIVFGFNEKETGYEYAVIVDPVVSAPELLSGSVGNSYQVGEIYLSDSMTILKNGDIVLLSGLSGDNIVYEISDFKKNKSYIQAYSQQVGGKLGAVLPNRISPQSVTVGGKTYELSKHLNLERLNGKKDTFNIGDNIILLFGMDDKVVYLK